MDVSIWSQYSCHYYTNNHFHDGHRIDTGNIYISVIIKRWDQHFPDHDHCESCSSTYSDSRAKTNHYTAHFNSYAEWKWFNWYYNQLRMVISIRTQHAGDYFTFQCSNDCNRI